MSHSATPRPAGHVLVPALAIGSMALALAGGLGALGFMDRLDEVIAAVFHAPAISQKSLPPLVLWLATGFISYGLAFAMLAVPCVWRRLVLWISTLALTLGWAPVLILAAREPAIGPAIIATIWTGVCALVYAQQHLMPVDASTATDTTRYGTR